MPRTFSLQPILSYRERVVDALMLALARLRRAEQETQAALASLRQSEQALFGELARRQVGMLDLTAIGGLRFQLRGVRDQIDSQDARLGELQAQIAARRSEITAAQQARKMLEKLRARERERWQMEEAHREAGERDDLYTARAHKSRPASG